MATPWWALLVGLLVSLPVLFISILLGALCCWCKLRCSGDPDQKKLDEEEQDSSNGNNSEVKSFTNHAVIHDEYATPAKRHSPSSSQGEATPPQTPENNNTESPLRPGSPHPEAHNRINGHVRHSRELNRDSPELQRHSPEVHRQNSEHESQHEEHYEVGTQTRTGRRVTFQIDAEHKRPASVTASQESTSSETLALDAEHEQTELETKNHELTEEVTEESDAEEREDEERGADRSSIASGTEGAAIIGAGAVGAGAVGAGAGVSAIYLEASKVSAVRLVREGTFGAIYEGEYEKDGKDIPVIIKTFLDGGTYGEKEKRELSEMGMLLHPVKHEHVMSPYGMTDKHGLPYVVYPEASNLDLKTYVADPHHVLSVRHLMDFTLHIAEAISFIHESGIIHKDIASRNCWVAEGMTVRVCDGALSQDLFPEDYETTYEIKKTLMPIRWLAPECLKYGDDFSTKSDVWAFGVLVWELFKRGMHRPYEEFNSQKVSDNVQGGDVLMKPFFAPNDVYRIMEKCWTKKPEERPEINDIIGDIRAIVNRRTITSTLYGKK